jgi:NAD(P)-dependent dehydrogenase (short-subunit alcohol dehydrogenase family)
MIAMDDQEDKMDRQPVANRFNGKTAIVTGGVSGIGRAVLDELCKEGASVLFLDLDAKGQEVAESWTSAHADVLFFQGDVSDEQVCFACAEAALKRWGKIDFLVNNAFSFIAKGLDATRADWERMMQVGPMAYAAMTQAVAPSMKQAGSGAIVNISSVSAFVAQPNRWTYNAAKGAVLNLTRCMAYDLAPFHIRVNSVSPGWIWTQEVYKAASLDGGGREKWDPSGASITCCAAAASRSKLQPQCSFSSARTPPLSPLPTWRWTAATWAWVLKAWARRPSWQVPSKVGWITEE